MKPTCATSEQCAECAARFGLPFCDLSDEALREFDRISKPVAFRRGSVLFVEGLEPAGMALNAPSMPAIVVGSMQGPCADKTGNYRSISPLSAGTDARVAVGRKMLPGRGESLEAACRRSGTRPLTAKCGRPRGRPLARWGSVRREIGGDVRWAVSARNPTELRPVTVGAAANERVEVFAGIQDGQSVVVNPPASLADGTHVSGQVALADPAARQSGETR